MLLNRTIPVLLLDDESLVKTRTFKKYKYVGDPCNTVRIFNELEVDELIFLDIKATHAGRAPNLGVLKDISKECFMPLAYGGGLQDIDTAKNILKIGYEKVVVNSHFHTDPDFAKRLSEHFGSQAVVASIDYKRDIWGKNRVCTHSGRTNTGKDPIEWALEMQECGAGEIILTSITREGSWSGYDEELLKEVSEKLSIPIIVNGGAGSVNDIDSAFRMGVSAAVGSMVVFQKKDMGVLVNMPLQKS